jgi:hypothetical protein
MPRKYSRKKTPQNPPEPTIYIDEVCAAFSLSPDASHLFSRIVQMSNQGRQEIRITFQESQTFLGLPPRELASAFEELHIRERVTVKSGYLPEKSFYELFIYNVAGIQLSRRCGSC